MKVVGWIMVIIAGLIIFYNVATGIENKKAREYNDGQIKNHPVDTFFSDGKNLKNHKNCYTFLPPYTGFELTVIICGLLGAGIVFFSKSSPPPSEPKPIEK